MAVDLVIFDCDGVLIDSEPLAIRTDVECLAEAGLAIPAAEIAERYTGISFAAMIADIETRSGRRLPADYPERYRARLRAAFEAELRPIEGVAALLDSLDRPVCVASSSAPERLRHSLTLVGLYDRFAPHVFSATMVAHGKPAPDLFLYAAAQMGAEPARCIVVEDSLPGIAAARAAAMKAIGFCGGSHCPPDHPARLAAAGAVATVGGMAGLGAVLARLRRGDGD